MLLIFPGLRKHGGFQRILLFGIIVATSECNGVLEPDAERIAVIRDGQVISRLANFNPNAIFLRRTGGEGFPGNLILTPRTTGKVTIFSSSSLVPVSATTNSTTKPNAAQQANLSEESLEGGSGESIEYSTEDEDASQGNDDGVVSIESFEGSEIRLSQVKMEGMTNNNNSLKLENSESPQESRRSILKATITDLKTSATEYGGGGGDGEYGHGNEYEDGGGHHGGGGDSGHHAKGYGGGESHHNSHHGQKGHKGHEGHHSNQGYHKGNQGHHHNAHKKGHYGSTGGASKHHRQGGQHYGGRHHGSKGNRHAKYGQNGHHKKGHATKGFHNVYHKEEYSKQHSFYDDHHQGGHHAQQGNHGQHHEDHGGKKYYGDHHDQHHHDNHQSHQGHYQNGHYDDAHKGYKGSHGNHAHHGHNEHYGNEGGDHHQSNYHEGKHHHEDNHHDNSQHQKQHHVGHGNQHGSTSYHQQNLGGYGGASAGYGGLAGGHSGYGYGY